MGLPKRDKSGCIMTQFGQSEMVIYRNQPSLFTPQSDRDMPGQIGTNRDNSTRGERHIPGHYIPPPLKGGGFCPGVTGRDMSRSIPVPAERNTNRNESAEGNFDPARNYPTPASIAAAFDAWDAEHAAWVAAGMQGDYPHPPAGLTSAIADRLIPRRAPHHGKRWR
jgi:hypothetical protein